MKNRFIIDVSQNTYNIIDTEIISVLGNNLIIATFTYIDLAKEYLEFKNKKNICSTN